jgi:integrase
MAKRRQHGEGSITEVQGGKKFMIRWWQDAPDGRRVRKTAYAKSKKEAQQKLNEAIYNQNKGIHFDETTILSEWLDRWLEDAVKGSVAEGSYRQYTIHANHHIKPTLGALKLARLTAAHIQSLYAEKLRSGLAPATIRLTHSVLHRSLDQAVKFGLIPQNPAKRVDPPRIKQDEITPLSPEAARTFLAAARGERFETLFTVALSTGMRIGELLGLRWEDVDLEVGTLRVSRQLQRYGDGKGPQLVAPKDGSSRTITLPQKALESLKHHRARQAEERLKAPWYAEEWDLVFASEVGTPLDPRHVTHRHFKPLLAKAGLPDIRFHDLRHACATLLLARGTHPSYVQQLLGHKSIKLTLDRYSHWMPSMGRATADGMDEALG